MRLRYPAAFWNATATVYTPGADGDFTVVAKTGLVCRLGEASTVFSGLDPAMGQPAMRLYWQDTDYALPDEKAGGCRVLVDGVMWAPQHGSERAPKPLAAVVLRSVDVVRAEA